MRAALEQHNKLLMENKRGGVDGEQNEMEEGAATRKSKEQSHENCMTKCSGRQCYQQGGMRCRMERDREGGGGVARWK